MRFPSPGIGVLTVRRTTFLTSTVTPDEVPSLHRLEPDVLAMYVALESAVTWRENAPSASATVLSDWTNDSSPPAVLRRNATGTKLLQLLVLELTRPLKVKVFDHLVLPVLDSSVTWTGEGPGAVVDGEADGVVGLELGVLGELDGEALGEGVDGLIEGVGVGVWTAAHPPVSWVSGTGAVASWPQPIVALASASVAQKRSFPSASA